MENFSYELFKIQVNRYNVKLAAETVHTKERVGLDDGVWSGFSWLRVGKSGELFQTW